LRIGVDGIIVILKEGVEKKAANIIFFRSLVYVDIIVL